MGGVDRSFLIGQKLGQNRDYWVMSEMCNARQVTNAIHKY